MGHEIVQKSRVKVKVCDPETDAVLEECIGDPLGDDRTQRAEVMPGPISDSYQGPPDDGPYVPSWCYRNGPRMCPCGHHEGFHNDAGACLRAAECHCTGLPADRRTPLDET